MEDKRRKTVGKRGRGRGRGGQGGGGGAGSRNRKTRKGENDENVDPAASMNQRVGNLGDRPAVAKKSRRNSLEKTFDVGFIHFHFIEIEVKVKLQ